MAAAGTLAVGLWAQGAGAAEVRNVTAEYAWPWGAEIRYEVVGTTLTNSPLSVTLTDRTGNVTYQAETSALSGDTGSRTGSHRLRWDLDKQGVKIQSTNVVFTVTYEPLYIVVDLSGGENAASYPVTGIEVLPSGGFNTDVYKTTKLVLRRIEAGTFKMVGAYQVTLTKPFYVGIFEVTQEQWTLVMGSNPSEFTGEMRPVNAVSYNDIRGGSAGANWPASNAVDAGSFLGKLRAKTGLEFDLPTEAQWEYACRAGTTSVFNNGGNSRDDLNKLGRWWNNGGSSSWHAKVGSYQPNAWNLYDMHGNAYEWCLDWFGDSLSAGTDPKGSSVGAWGRVARGGSMYSSSYHDCRSDARSKTSPNSRGVYLVGDIGFRLARTLSAE